MFIEHLVDADGNGGGRDDGDRQGQQWRDAKTGDNRQRNEGTKRRQVTMRQMA